jgi:hypothetical protein
MVVRDLKRRVRTDVNRTNLFRIGHAVDWFGLAHGLARPSGPCELSEAERPPHADTPGWPCRWFLLTSAGMASTICWSPALHLPVLITGPDGAVQWRLTRVDTRPLPANTFDVDDAGFIRSDANEDIQGD